MYRLLIAVAGFLLAGLSSCTEATQRSPEETTKAFLSHFKNRDYDAAKKLASQETDRTVGMIKQLMTINEEMKREMPENLITKEFDPNTDFTYSCKEEGQTASCQCCEPSSEECMTINLIQENGQWVVHQPKENNIE